MFILRSVKKNDLAQKVLWPLLLDRFETSRMLEVPGMTCCCASCDARMIELVQAIDDLRRSLVIVLQEAKVSSIHSDGDDSYYWNHG